MITAKDISQQLAQRAEGACEYLLPNGKRAGGDWCVGNINGEPGNSLKVQLTGTKVGVWCDFATGKDKGDLLDLWAAVRNTDLSKAIKEAKIWLGIGSTTFVAYKPPAFEKPNPDKLSTLSAGSDVYSYLTQDRGLLPETLADFQVGQKHRALIMPYIRDGEVLQIKYLNLERDEKGKKQFRVEKNCEPCLFGWHLIPQDARKITICEGEIDAMTLHQYGIPTLSVPFGAGTGDKHKWLEYEFERLSVYDEIFLCFDNDNAGKEAVIELPERLGRYRCRIVSLPHKDPNDCLKAGVSREKMHQFFKEAKTLDPEELKQASALVDKVIDEFYPPAGVMLGYSAPWEKLAGKVMFRPAELTIFTGINGHGKSQILGHILLHLMQQGACICIASLELKPSRLLMRLTRQAAGLAEPTNEYVRAIHQWYEDKLWLFDLVGTAKSERLLEVFLYARRRYGIDVFVIDSFLKLDIAEDDYKAQKSFIEKLCDFKNQHNCHVFLVVHPRKGADETKLPGKLDNKGTGAISDLADNCITIWRNKAKEELKRKSGVGINLSPQDQAALKISDCLLSCDKNRNGSWEGRAGLWFDQRSFQYLNHEAQKPTQYVAYSNTTQGV